MKQEDWKKAIDKAWSSDRESMQRQMELEKSIVDAYASEHGLAYETAERQLAESREILAQPQLEVTDVYTRQDGNNGGEAGIRQLRQLMDIGERAIAEFEKTRAYQISFPNARLNHSTCGGWYGSPWHGELNFHRLSDRFEESQDRFQFQSVGNGSDMPLTFTFGYQTPKKEE